MKIEYFKEDETDNYILKIPYVKLTEEKKICIFIDSDAFNGLMQLLPDEAYDKDNTVYKKVNDMQYNPEYRDLIITAISIIPYEMGNHSRFSSPQKDIIWKQLIEMGIVIPKNMK
jgi:hypothetical protein